MDENSEKIVKKYKLLRHKIITHYKRGCRYLVITKILVAISFVIFTLIAIGVSNRTGERMGWLLLWIIVIFLNVIVFTITDYTKYLIASKVIPYLENDDIIDFGEYDIFIEPDDDEDEEEEEDEDDE
ncbi:MAG: hypothetical protein IJ851_06920 [Eubacterium sp.]|nr:hypothetical protein [Eubacterium sp.]